VPNNHEGSGRKEPDNDISRMRLSPGFQQIAFVDTETGDYGEQRLEHSEGAEKFYRDLAAQGKRYEWEWKLVACTLVWSDSWRN